MRTRKRNRRSLHSAALRSRCYKFAEPLKRCILWIIGNLLAAFVISTGVVMGLRLTQGDEKRTGIRCAARHGAASRFPLSSVKQTEGVCSSFRAQPTNVPACSYMNLSVDRRVPIDKSGLPRRRYCRRQRRFHQRTIPCSSTYELSYLRHRRAAGPKLGRSDLSRRAVDLLFPRFPGNVFRPERSEMEGSAVSLSALTPSN